MGQTKLPVIETETLREQVGVGDGTCSTFSIQLRRAPVIPGSVSLYITQPDAVSRLGCLVGDASEIARDDWIGKPPYPGTLEPRTGRVRRGNFTIRYAGGLVQLQFKKPPPRDAVLTMSYDWHPPRLRYCKVQVQHPDGELEWVSLVELKDALMR
jgi:hypothetical protein